MPSYAILIYQDEQSWADASDASSNQVYEGHVTFGSTNQAALRGGEALERTTTATTIRPDGTGGFTVTDGPFAETKEALGGFYLIDASDLDEAITIAKQVPSDFGCVEVRPVRVFD